MTDYPTEEQLDALNRMSPIAFNAICEKVCELWKWKDRCHFDGESLLLSTGGWSGNEDVVDSIPDLFKFMHFAANTTGGHWLFSKNGEVKDRAIKALYGVIDEQRLERSRAEDR